MKKQIYKKRVCKKKKKEHHTKKPMHYSLGDLIAILAGFTRRREEVVAVLSHLFRSGKVFVQSGHVKKRLRLVPSSP